MFWHILLLAFFLVKDHGVNSSEIMPHDLQFQQSSEEYSEEDDGLDIEPRKGLRCTDLYNKILKFRQDGTLDQDHQLPECDSDGNYKILYTCYNNGISSTCRCLDKISGVAVRFVPGPRPENKAEKECQSSVEKTVTSPKEPEATKAQDENADCLLPVKQGRYCYKKYTLRYFFDGKSCKYFWYTGCDGNGNNFSKLDCEGKCK